MAVVDTCTQGTRLAAAYASGEVGIRSDIRLRIPKCRDEDAWARSIVFALLFVVLYLRLILERSPLRLHIV